MVSRQGRDGPKENKTNKNRRRSTRKKIVVSENRVLWTSLISDLNYWIGRTVGKKKQTVKDRRCDSYLQCTHSRRRGGSDDRNGCSDKEPIRESITREKE